ncbi:MAG: PEP-CTERM sorting domain-containing protein [Syntrophobacteraceae bacterium]
MKLIAILTAALLLVSAQISLANTLTFVTPAGSFDSNGEPVSAQATVTTGKGIVTVDLSNLITNQKDVGQAVSDFSVNLSGSGLKLTSITSSANSITVSSHGSVTDNGTVTDFLSSSHYQLGGNTLSIDWLGAGQPKYTVLGPVSANGKYDNANRSIAGNGPHNPFLNGDVTFTFDISGVTSNTNLSGAVFSFGTQSGDNIKAADPVPEPSSLLLLGSVVLGYALIFRRGKRA